MQFKWVPALPTTSTGILLKQLREESRPKVKIAHAVQVCCATMCCCFGPEASFGMPLVNCRPPCAPAYHTTIIPRLPQELPSRHRASAGSACNTGVWLRGQSPFPARLGQKPPTGCPLPMLQSKGRLIRVKGSVWRGERQQLQVAHCLPDAGL